MPLYCRIIFSISACCELDMNKYGIISCFCQNLCAKYDKFQFIVQITKTCRERCPQRSVRKFDLDGQIFCIFLHHSAKMLRFALGTLRTAFPTGLHGNRAINCNLRPSRINNAPGKISPAQMVCITDFWRYPEWLSHRTGPRTFPVWSAGKRRSPSSGCGAHTGQLPGSRAHLRSPGRSGSRRCKAR